MSPFQRTAPVIAALLTLLSACGKPTPTAPPAEPSEIPVPPAAEPAPVPENTSWVTELGVEGLDQPLAIQWTGRHFILAGRMDAESAGTDAYLSRLDINGEPIWRKTYGGANRDFPMAILDLGDTIMFAGQSSSFRDFSGDAWVVHTDATGEVIREQTYGRNGTDAGIAIVEAPENGFTAFARSFQGGEGMNLLILHLDADGNIAAEQSVGGPGDQFFNQVLALENGQLLAAGTTGTLNSNDGKPILIVLDTDGVIATRTEIDAPGFINPESVFVQPTSDGGYVLVAGYLTEDKQLPAWSGKDKSESIVLFKIDAAGETEWSRSYGGELWDSPRAVFDVPDDEGDDTYIVVAATESYGAGGEDILLFRVDATGERLWERTIGSEDNEFPRAAVRLEGDHGGLAIAATRRPPDTRDSALDTLVIKTDREGHVMREGENWSTDGLTPRPDPDAIEEAPDMIVAGDAPDIGDEAPEINAVGWINTEGVPTLESLRGSVVVVEFWATWCGPCRATIPHLRDLHNKYNDTLTILSLTDEDREVAKIDAFIADNGMPYATGTGSTSINDYGVIGIPTAFVIGRDGTITWRGHPQSDLETAIESALSESTPQQ